MVAILAPSELRLLRRRQEFRHRLERGDLQGYIVNPQAKIPGTKMSFPGLKNPQQVNDLWAYIQQFNADGSIKN